MSKRRLRALKRQFKAKFGRLPYDAAPDQPSEVRTLKRAWRTFRQIVAKG